MKPKLAIIGSGIAAVGCAHHLKDDFAITIYEKNDYLGGHTHTHRLEEGGVKFTVDTGFIIFNLRTYPHLVRLFEELGVARQRSVMTFSVWNRISGIYYSSGGPRGYFARAGSVFSPAHWSLLREVLRFYRVARADRMRVRGSEETAAAYCARYGFSENFMWNYLYPVVSAIWSAGAVDAPSFPVSLLIPFFYNHGMLQVWPPVHWYSVVGGSDTYTRHIVERGNIDVRLSEPVERVSDEGGRVRVTTAVGESSYDYALLACHADTSLAIAPGLPRAKRELLAKYPYTKNRAVLHTDAAVMPPDRRAWASWNHVMVSGKDGRPVTSTVYWLNPLQRTNAKRDYFVSINPVAPISARHVIKDMTYEHPHFSVENVLLQEKLKTINDDGRILFAGAYFRHGFHEDGLVAGKNAADALRARTGA